MTSHEMSAQIQTIPLNRLKKSPRNVRQTAHDKTHIEALAASLVAHGQIQNLVVETETDGEGNATGDYLVTAGEGRRQALLLLVKRKKVKADVPVRCIVDDSHDARALSLAENELRRSMGVVDQLVAFRELVDSGKSIEDVAVQFGVTPLVVQRRLKLANVAPEFLELHRKEQINTEILIALAVVDDHEKQRRVWQSLSKHNRHPDIIRRALTEDEIALREPVVKFVGVKVYEKAGGAIRRDLFAERDDDGYIMDAELLHRLAREKLDRVAAKLKAQGRAWVEIIPQLDYATRSAYGRVRTVLRDATAGEESKANALRAQLAEIDTQAQAADDDEQQSMLSDRAEEIEAELEALEEQRHVPDARQQALAGAIVSIGHDGRVEVLDGLLKPEDAKRFKQESKTGNRGGSTEESRIHSAALTRRLTAHRTFALQATLTRCPEVALLALTQQLVLDTFFSLSYGVRQLVQIRADQPSLGSYGADLKGCKAQVALDQQGEAWRQMLPEDPQRLFAWLRERPSEERMRLFAYCVARTVNGVSAEEEGSVIDEVAKAAGLDMREWFAPTAENYFRSIPKARILEAVREAVSPDVAASLAGLKKGALSQEAEKRLAGTGWLPGVLRGQAA